METRNIRENLTLSAVDLDHRKVVKYQGNRSKETTFIRDCFKLSDIRLEPMRQSLQNYNKYKKTSLFSMQCEHLKFFFLRTRPPKPGIIGPGWLQTFQKFGIYGILNKMLLPHMSKKVITSYILKLSFPCAIVEGRSRLSLCFFFSASPCKKQYHSRHPIMRSFFVIKTKSSPSEQHVD